jgi:uncharacterized protein YukE
MEFFSTRVLWNGPLRLVAFWLIFFGTVAAASFAVPVLDLPLIARTIALALQGHLEDVSTQAFAFALAALIFFTGLGFAVAYLIMHVVLIRLALADARRQVTVQKTSIDFAERFDVIHKRLSQHPLIGHAWRAFDQTAFRKAGSDEIQTTVRPGTLINIGNARERLTGLKMMASVPGYFVGVGLFLTFIGLVLALQQAAAAVSSSDADGMQAATRQLLKVATFKFATSIAGLGTSIVLSVCFRTFTIWIETAFDRFNHELEDRLRFVSSQAIAWNMSESLAAQLTELKQINSADFFAHLGESISPQIQTAFVSAMVPVTTSIDAAVAGLAQSSQTGVAELVTQFTESLHVGAGAELRELTTTIQSLRGALAETQSGIGKTGEDFARRMSEAAANLSRMAADAGHSLRDSLAEAVQSMRADFDSFTNTIRSVETAVSAQVGALRVAADQTRLAADAFGGTAQDVRSATGPLLQSGETIANATLGIGSAVTAASDRLADSVSKSVASFEAGQQAAGDVAVSIRGHIDQLATIWAAYSEKFERVDKDLGAAITDLGGAVTTQGQQLASFASEVDEGFAKAISNLNPFLEDLKSNTETLGDAVSDLKKAFLPQAAE